MTDLHPVLNRTILDRPELRRAYETDAEVRGDVQLLGRFVGALASLVRVDVIEALLRDPEVLPSEADFRRRHYERTRYERALELGATAAPVRVEPPPCPECAAGKCQNCTGETMVLEVMVACPCLHDGSGFLAGPVLAIPDPVKMAATRVTCVKLGDREHYGVHAQTSGCVFPLAQSEVGP